MDIKNYGLKGTGSVVEIGKGGSKVKENSGAIEIVTNADENVFAVVRGADPVNDNDFVTKRYVDSKASVVVSGQINGGAPPVVVNGAIYVVTTTGGGYTVKQLWRGEGGSWVAVTPIKDGLVISVTTDLTGGTIEFIGDHLYEWDLTSTTWVDMGAATSVVTLPKFVEMDWEDSVADTTFGVKIPLNAIITQVRVNVTEAWDDIDATLLVETDQSDILAANSDISIQNVGLYIVDCFHKVDTVGGEYVQYTMVPDGAGAGEASIEVIWSRVDS